MHRPAALAIGLALSTAASAGGAHYHGYGGHGYGYGHGHHRSYGHHHRYRHGRHDRKYGYLAAGLLVGVLIHELADRRRHEPVRASRSYRYVTRGPAVEPAPEQVPASEFDRYYRVEPDGSCFLIERTPEGEFIATEEDPSICR